MLELDEQLARVQGAADLAAFIVALRADLISHPERWQQNTLESYFESMAAWLIDVKPTGPDLEQVIPLPPDAWRMIGEVLFAASMYE